MITTQTIEQAEARAAEARRKAAALRKHGAVDAEDMVQRAVTAAVELREAKARQDESLKVRKAAEKPHAAELREMGESLEASADKVATAAQGAAQALSGLVAAVTAHNEVVHAAHARLMALGLPLGDDAVSAYETGAGRDGELRVFGEYWSPAAADAVAQVVISGVMGSCFGSKHPAARVSDIRVHSLRRGSYGKLVDRITAA
ncbi:hypothetical protein [Streptomyces sp. NPDC096153]|uniref:hypothetical protein n=1 Tax=Streptomyces sp. NPDC096153 TaxID=3155548 RepID=UPI00332CBFE8